MKNKKQRQAMTVTPKELRNLADELEKEVRRYTKTVWRVNINKMMHKKQPKTVIGKTLLIEHTKFSVPIINEEGCSDTWRFE